MDALDVVILALRLALVGLLYLFLLSVMRFAARGLRTAPAVARPPADSAELRLIVVDAGGAALRAGQVVRLNDGATLGRGTAADVVLADSTVSAEHARVFRVGRAWVVSDLGSTNGT